MAKREFPSLPSGATGSKITTMTATSINHLSVHANDFVRANGAAYRSVIASP
jgi:hypothetical protein